jgi:mono/diheme cytochrome c family protein
MNAMDRRGFIIAVLSCILLTAAGCRAPGKPGPEPEVVRPEQVTDFATLYKQNCAACHGENGRHGNAISLANPVYLALAGRDVLIQTMTKGRPGALMPAFAKSQGGALTDQQIEILADGMVRHWGRKGLLDGQNPPAYAATTTGDATAGKENFAGFCARCHRAAAPGGQVVIAGPVSNPSYLALISDQGLRSMILAGRPDDGMPDWRGFGDRPLTDQQVTDIVAWLASQRRAVSGHANAK